MNRNFQFHFDNNLPKLSANCVRRNVKSTRGPISSNSTRGKREPDFFNNILYERILIILSISMKCITCSKP
ncbi:hypothetical protein DERP_012994 [Dermatophagoides pteronyssinus]|uniref:Uncharacterized protein n=1 Tax=Dermatophagoides pteronyssinus TaxID=6956 RepID=A0ABQ8ISI9_DERPT|nr:hypothetical protein DERP_012994 [Dermatophagoides pteronyssinus]